MAKFITNIIIFFSIVCSLVAVCFAGMFKYIEYFENKYSVYTTVSHEVNIPRSINNIKSCKGHKIILVGGSNVGFGINSELISSKFGMPVFNTGTHAGLGLRLQIELFQEYMKEGDIIVIIPEYWQFYGGFLGNEPMIRIIASDNRYRKYVSFMQWIHATSYICPALKELSETIDSSGVYGSSSLNKYGDISKNRTHCNIIADKKTSKELDKKAFRYLCSFTKKCPSTIILLPPVYQDKSYDNNSEKINDYSLEYAAEPIRYRFNDTLMYDTPYHCTSEGALIRTQMVIEDIQKFLNK